MSCGVPVIATDCMTGPREILGYDKGAVRGDFVEAEYGILCPAFESDFINDYFNDKILANAIVQLVTNASDHTRYSVRAQLRAKMFSFEQYRERLLEVVFHEKGE